MDSRYISFIHDTIVHTAQKLQWNNFALTKDTTHLTMVFFRELYDEKWPIYAECALYTQVI